MSKHFRLFDRDWVTNYRRKFNRGKNLGSLKMCKKCYTFYYKNSWHFDKPKSLEEAEEPVISVHFTQCPACLEEELSLYNLEILPT